MIRDVQNTVEESNYGVLIRRVFITTYFRVFDLLTSSVRLLAYNVITLSTANHNWLKILRAISIASCNNLEISSCDLTLSWASFESQRGDARCVDILSAIFCQDIRHASAQHDIIILLASSRAVRACRVPHDAMHSTRILCEGGRPIIRHE